MACTSCTVQHPNATLFKRENGSSVAISFAKTLYNAFLPKQTSKHHHIEEANNPHVQHKIAE